MKVIVNRALCDGNGNCAAAAPELFLLNENDELIVLMDEFGEDLRARAEVAVAACPKNALSLKD